MSATLATSSAALTPCLLRSARRRSMDLVSFSAAFSRAAARSASSLATRSAGLRILRLLFGGAPCSSLAGAGADAFLLARGAMSVPFLSGHPASDRMPQTHRTHHSQEQWRPQYLVGSLP